MKALALVLLAACSAPSSSPRHAEPARDLPRAAAAHPDPPPPPAPTLHVLRESAVAPHGGPIQALALSPDGIAALTTDTLGGARLWSSFDGKQEPRILELPLARDIAISSRADGFTAVALDEVGGLYLAKLDASARVVSHTTLAPDPAFIGMAMSEVGLVAWRADQTVVLLDADGATKTQVTTRQGERIVTLAVAGSRAIAVLDRSGQHRRARWLTLEPKLDWGEWVDLKGDLTGNLDIALAPRGDRLALITRGETSATATVVALPTGKVLASQPFPQPQAEIAFADEDHVAVGGRGVIEWFELGKPAAGYMATKTTLVGASRAEALLGGGAGHAVSALNGDLVIATPTDTHFLGYEMITPRLAEVGPDGQLLVATAEDLMWLDKDLHVARSPALPFKNAPAVVEMRWLGNSDWLVESGGYGALQLELLDGATGTSKMVRPQLHEAQVLSYEPSTKLVTLSFGARLAEVVRYDRAAHAFEPVAQVGKPNPYEQVLLVPVAPKLARGTQLIEVRMRDKSTIKWLRDPHALNSPSATAVVDGPFAAADAAGNVYVWRPSATGQLELVVYSDGKQVRTLPNTGPASLWPEPTGTRVVQTSQTSITMLDAAGKPVWVQPIATAQEALWLSDGAIGITTAGGVARLDPATGAVTAARCGWKFGLTGKLHPSPPNVEPLCAQLRR